MSATTTTPVKNPWLIVAKREMLVTVTNKAFIISTLMSVFLIALGFFLVPMLSGGTTKIATVGPEAKALAQSIAAAPDAKEANTKQIRIIEVTDKAAGEALLNSDKATLVLLPSAGGFDLLVKRFDQDTIMQQMKFDAAAKAHAMSTNASKAGVSLEQLAKGGAVTARALDGSSGKDGMGIFFAGFAFSILFFMSALMYGMALATSVVSEKQSRLAEILTTSIPVRQLLIGKVVAYTVISLVQLLVVVTVGLIGMSQTEFKTLVPQVSAGAIWFVPFFLLGFVALSCIWAGTGAMATRQEDLGQTSSPLTMVLAVVYMVSFMAKGTAAAVMSYVPILSSLIMPIRMMRGEAAWWEGAIAMLLTVGFCVVAIRVGEKIYRRGLLHTSGLLSFRKALMGA